MCQWTDLLVDAAELLSKELTLHVLLLTAPALPARSGSGFTGCNANANISHIILHKLSQIGFGFVRTEADGNSLVLHIRESLIF